MAGGVPALRSIAAAAEPGVGGLGALAAAVFYVVANSVPMLGVTVVGREASTTVLGGALHLWQSGQEMVALLVLFTAVVAPAMQIVLTLAIVLGARRQPAPDGPGRCCAITGPRSPGA
jgi:uncharacterized paraquat-inducible protein A